MKYSVFAFALALVIGGASCAPAGECAGDSDCPFGYVCSSATCAIASQPVQESDNTGAGTGTGTGTVVVGGGGGDAGVGECAGASRAMVLDGDEGEVDHVDRDFVHPGAERFSAGNWAAFKTGPFTYFVSHIPPDGTQWGVNLSSEALGVVLAPGTYPDAQRAGRAQQGHPGLLVSREFRVCEEIAGSFDIDEIEIDPQSGALRRLSMRFSQFCQKGTAELRGCLSFTAQDRKSVV